MTKSCFHCDLDIPSGIDFHILFDNEKQPLCCAGCQAVAQTIIDHGLSDYYQFRDKPAQQSMTDLPQDIQDLLFYDRDDVQLQYTAVSDNIEREISLSIQGIHCAACIWLIETQIKKIPGVKSIQVNLSNHLALLKWDNEQVKLSTILHTLHTIGYQATPYDLPKQQQLRKQEQQYALRRLAVAGLGMMQVMSFATALYLGDFQGMALKYQLFFHWISLLVVTPILYYSGKPFYQSAWRSLRYKHLSMDLSIAIALSGAYLASAYATFAQQGDVYFDSIVMLIFFISLGRFLERQARFHCGETLQKLQQQTPQSVTLYNNQQARLVPLQSVKIDDLILVKSGEILAVDGIVIEGNAEISETLLTGETTAKIKSIGDNVLAGSQNGHTAFVMQVTAVGVTTKLAKIIQLSQRALSEKIPLLALTQKLAHYFVISVLCIACLVALSWLFIAPEKALWITLSVLIVTCPCALALATPVALTATHNTLMKQGFLTTRGHVLESLAKATHIVFDKTGTLTMGHYQIKAIDCFPGWDAKTALSIACVLESPINHPLASAFIGQSETLLKTENVSYTVNAGVEANIEKQIYRFGKAKFSSQLYSSSVLPKPPSQENLCLLLADDKGPIAWFQLCDTIRPTTESTIQALKKQGLSVILLSGDPSSATKQLAEKLHIDQAYWDKSPEQKLQLLENLQKAGAQLVMVGDGLNDLPALSAAQVSIAMGEGCDIAKTQADAVLLNNDMKLLVQVFYQAKKTHRIIKQNITWALLYNICVLPMASLGLIPTYLAAIGMSFSSLLVVLNALRLNKLKTSALDN